MHIHMAFNGSTSMLKASRINCIQHMLPTQNSKNKQELDFYRPHNIIRWYATISLSQIIFSSNIQCKATHYIIWYVVATFSQIISLQFLTATILSLKTTWWSYDHYQPLHSINHVYHLVHLRNKLVHLYRPCYDTISTIPEPNSNWTNY